VVGDWILDSAAFSEIKAHGRFRHDVKHYAREIRRWAKNAHGRLLAAVSQDWMCETEMLERTALADAEAAMSSPDPIARMAAGLARGRRLTPSERAERVRLHQTRTIERYDALLAEETGVYIMPVLQGYAPEEYVAHLRAYGKRLTHGMWVGVGSVCKRNGNPGAIVAVLSAIKAERPDLRLHGFGLKKTSLQHDAILDLLETADSMAWSQNARKNGRNANDWRQAKRWTDEMLDRTPSPQQALDLAYSEAAA